MFSQQVHQNSAGKVDRSTNTLAFGAAVLLGLALSVLSNLTSDNINSDGILYVEAAKAFSEGGLGATMAYYQWPFLSILIGTLADILSIEFETSARIIVALAYATLSGGFVLLCSQLSSGPSIGWFAAVVITFMVGTNEYRDYIIRDPGMWACLVLTVYFFLRFLKCPSLALISATFFWGVLGTLFRPEMLVYLAGTMSFALFLPGAYQERSKILLLCAAPILVCLILLVSILVISGVDFEAIKETKLQDIKMHLSGEVFLRFWSKAEAMAAAYLPNFGDDGPRAILIGIIGICALTALTKLGFGYCILFIASSGSPSAFSSLLAMRLLMWITIISLSVGVAGVIQGLFLQGRLLVPASIFLAAMLSVQIQSWWAQHSLEAKSKTSWAKAHPIFSGLLFILVIANVLDPFVQTGERKDFFKETGKWVKENLHHDSRLLSDDCMLYYYSGRYKNAPDSYGTYRKSCNKNNAEAFLYELDKITQYDYLMINLKERNGTEKIKDLLVSGAIQKDNKLPADLSKKIGLYSVVRND